MEGENSLKEIRDNLTVELVDARIKRWKSKPNTSEYHEADKEVINIEGSRKIIDILLL